MRGVSSSSLPKALRAFVGILFFLTACGPTSTTAPSGPLSPPTGGVGKIALLLPYGDDNRKDLIDLAQNLENSAKLALQDQGASGLELQIYETKGSVDGAVAATNAALDEGANVILGPVFKDAAIASARLAAAQNIPVLSFSNDSSIVGGNLYVLGHTFENSANRIIDFASDNRRQKILSVYAQNQQGFAGHSAVQTATVENNSELLSSVSYEFSQKGVVDAIPKIVDAATLSEADVIVFTADTAGGLPLLGQLLPEAGIDLELVKFTGLTRWDIPRSNLSNSGLQGGWFPLPDPNLSASFSHRYQYEFNAIPHPLSGLAYDGIIAAHGMLQQNSRRANLDTLRRASGFVGSTGPFRFHGNGKIERSLAIAEIRNNRVEIVSPAPRSFAPAAPPS